MDRWERSQENGEGRGGGGGGGGGGGTREERGAAFFFGIIAAELMGLHFQDVEILIKEMGYLRTPALPCNIDVVELFFSVLGRAG